MPSDAEIPDEEEAVKIAQSLTHEEWLALHSIMRAHQPLCYFENLDASLLRKGLVYIHGGNRVSITPVGMHVLGWAPLFRAQALRVGGLPFSRRD
jgi:hypothetical protein